MLKKTEVLEILNNGGHITLNDIYRSANVYSYGGENLGVCRYDTAERIGRSEDHTIRNGESWSFTRYIEKTDIPAEMAAAEETPAAAPQERSADQENREHCQRIAQNLEAYAEGRIYKCPECGEEFELYDMYGENFHIDEEGNEIGKCPGCGYTSEAYNEFEQLGLYDYFSDCLDIEYRVSGRGRDDLRSVRIMVAFGGPNIYIDTASKAVELYWWTDRASYLLSHDVCDAIDEWAAEYWSCL